MCVSVCVCVLLLVCQCMFGCAYKSESMLDGVLLCVELLRPHVCVRVCLCVCVRVRVGLCLWVCCSRCKSVSFQCVLGRVCWSVCVSVSSQK